MDTTTTDINFPSEQSADMVLSAEAKYFLHTAGRWANFLSILGFIGTALLVILAFFIGAFMAFITRFNPAATPETTAATSGMSGVLTVVYLGIAVLYFFMSYYLNRFASYIKKGVVYNSTSDTTKAFQNLKSHLKLIGIVAIVAISFYVLVIIVVIIAASAGLMSR